MALIDALISAAPKLKITYIGSEKGMESDLIADLSNVEFRTIATGKLRRYFSLDNFTDLFKVVKGIGQSYKILKTEAPKLIFSKGGFVSLPVVIAGRLLKIPIIIHESDSSPGLTTKLTAPWASEIWYSDGDLRTYFTKFKKAKLMQMPVLVRRNILQGDKETAKELTGFKGKKPVLLIIGGSLGAEVINQNIDKALPKLLINFDIIHVCGKGKLRKAQKGYKTYEYVTDVLHHFYALADIILGRAGATSLAEWSFLGKPVILVPLAQTKSRGEQLMNAAKYLQKNTGIILTEDELSPAKLTSAVAKMAAQTTDPVINNLDKLDELALSYVQMLCYYLNQICPN